MTSPPSSNAEDYVSMETGKSVSLTLTPQEMRRLQSILRMHEHNPNSNKSSNPRDVFVGQKQDDSAMSLAANSTDSDYPHFVESTHAWAVFADDPRKSASRADRAVGLLIIFFQLFTYGIFVAEAVEDFQAGRVPVMVRHEQCLASDYSPEDSFECDAEYTNTRDSFIAFFMLGIFLASDMLQALRVIRDARMGFPKLFAALAGIEVICAFLAAGVSVSYNLYIGEVTDAVEVGVGLLFIRELSSQTYRGIRDGAKRQYVEFCSCLVVLVALGMCMDPVCERLFATSAR